MSASDNRRGILVLASLNADLVVRVLALPTGGETVLGQDTGMSPGGRGANQAVAAALAGAEVTMAGRASTVLAALEEAGVDISSVAATDRSTGLAVVLVAEDGEGQAAAAAVQVHGARLNSLDVNGGF